jgi:ferredoxin
MYIATAAKRLSTVFVELQKMNSFFLLVALALIAGASAFFRTTASSRVQSGMSMMFGGGKKTAAAQKVVINVDNKVIESAEKTVNLRKELIANKVDVYPLKAKLTGNCGGAGICGTCAVKVLSGMENLNPPSKNEQNTLRNKPNDFRLSCCARVSGPITIKTKVY